MFPEVFMCRFNSRSYLKIIILNLTDSSDRIFYEFNSVSKAAYQKYTTVDSLHSTFCDVDMSFASADGGRLSVEADPFKWLISK
ncbi:hypothetical protein Tco_0514921 [Tanacetum coccineum]